MYRSVLLEVQKVRRLRYGPLEKLSMRLPGPLLAVPRHAQEHDKVALN